MCLSRPSTRRTVSGEASSRPRSSARSARQWEGSSTLRSERSSAPSSGCSSPSPSCGCYSASSISTASPSTCRPPPFSASSTRTARTSPTPQRSGWRLRGPLSQPRWRSGAPAGGTSPSPHLYPGWVAAPVRKGEELELRIDSLAYGGNGVARHDGFVVFARGGLPGDTVRARLTKVQRGFAEGVVNELLETSPVLGEAHWWQFGWCGGWRFL